MEIPELRVSLSGFEQEVSGDVTVELQIPRFRGLKRIISFERFHSNITYLPTTIQHPSPKNEFSTVDAIHS